MNAKPKPRIRPHHTLETEDGTVLFGPRAAVEAIEHHIAGEYGDDGSAVLWTLRAVVSETWADALGGAVGIPLRISEETTPSSAVAFGMPRESSWARWDALWALQLVCGTAVARMTEVPEQWCTDMLADPLPLRWAQSRLALIPKAPHQLKITELPLLVCSGPSKSGEPLSCCRRPSAA